MKRIKNTGAAVLTVRGIGPFKPGEVREVPDNVAQELLRCNVFVEARPAPPPRVRYESRFHAKPEPEKDKVEE